MFNDGVHDSLITAEFELFADLSKVVTNIKIDIPENDRDQEYRREALRTTMDVGKFFKGIQGNFFAKAFSENFFQSINFVPAFPIKKVSHFLLFQSLEQKFFIYF